MSNHSGSHMLNRVLFLLDEQGLFEHLGKEKTLNFLKEIKAIGWDNDCNRGEILDEIGEKLGVCCQCWKYGEELEHGTCKECRKTWHVK